MWAREEAAPDVVRCTSTGSWLGPGGCRSVLRACTQSLGWRLGEGVGEQATARLRRGRGCGEGRAWVGGRMGWRVRRVRRERRGRRGRCMVGVVGGVGRGGEWRWGGVEVVERRVRLVGW